MAEFPLTNTASDVDVALQKVVGITTTPLPSNINTITSGGVHAALQTLNHTNMDAGFLVTEAEGIENNDTDTQIPTCAAVKGLVDGSTSITSITTLSRASEYTLASETYTNVPSVVINGSNIVAVGDGTYTISAGVYAFEGSAELYASGSSYVGFGYAQLRIAAGSGAFALDSTMEHTTDTYTQKTIGTQVLYFPSDTNLILQFRDNPANATYQVRVQNISFSFLKIK